MQPPLTWHEALSGIFGSISLAAWIFVLVPQLIENYRLQSASGVSLLFLCVWFLGDVTNLIGAAWAGLVPTVIALAVYFCCADFILIGQCLYYNFLNARRDQREQRRLSRVAAASTTDTMGSEQTGEREPLLGRTASVVSQGSNIGLPGSHRRRRSSAASSGHLRRESGVAERYLGDIDEEDANGGSGWLRNTVSVLLVCAIGTVGWLLAYRSGLWQPAIVAPGDDEDEHMAVGAQILGYVSAVAYLGARIPQIYKNHKDKSCEGLSLLFFILSLIGNSTYGAGILFHSVDRQYVTKNLPWLIGSIGTIAEDLLIFVQFRLYKVPKDEFAAV